MTGVGGIQFGKPNLSFEKPQPAAAFQTLWLRFAKLHSISIGYYSDEGHCNIAKNISMVTFLLKINLGMKCPGMKFSGDETYQDEVSGDEA